MSAEKKNHKKTGEQSNCWTTDKTFLIEWSMFVCLSDVRDASVFICVYCVNNVTSSASGCCVCGGLNFNRHISARRQIQSHWYVTTHKFMVLCHTLCVFLNSLDLISVTVGWGLDSDGLFFYRHDNFVLIEFLMLIWFWGWLIISQELRIKRCWTFFFSLLLNLNRENLFFFLIIEFKYNFVPSRLYFHIYILISLQLLAFDSITLFEEICQIRGGIERFNSCR